MAVTRHVMRTTAGVVMLASALVGCGSSHADSRGGAVRVVASTDVYGDIASEIAGDLAGHGVTITSIISDPSADPHSYEASTQNQLALSEADVVIENGGGYDDFVDRMLHAAGNSSAQVLNVVDLSGKKAAGGADLNEHVWYDFPTMATLTDRLVAALSAADSADAATFARNGAAFEQQLSRLEANEASIKAAHAGAGVAITEPVPLYLLDACGLVNKTPPEFSEAVEDGTDVSVAVLHQTLDLFSEHAVSLLAYNEQTSGPETEQVLSAAKAAGVPVVPVTETLPAGRTYVTWMQSNLSAVQSALG